MVNYETLIYYLAKAIFVYSTFQRRQRIKIKILNNNSSWHLFLELIVTMDLTPIKSKAIIPKKHAVKRKRVASVLSVIDSVCVETANEI